MPVDEWVLLEDGTNVQEQKRQTSNTGTSTVTVPGRLWSNTVVALLAPNRVDAYDTIPANERLILTVYRYHTRMPVIRLW